MTRKGKTGPSEPSAIKTGLSEKFFLSWKCQSGNDFQWDSTKSLKSLKFAVSVMHLGWNIVFARLANMCMQ